MGDCSILRETVLRCGTGRSFELRILAAAIWIGSFGCGKNDPAEQESGDGDWRDCDDFAALGDANPDIWLPISQMPYFVEGSKALTDASAGTVEMWGRLAPGNRRRRWRSRSLLTLTNEYRKLYPKVVWDKEYVKSDPGGHFTVAKSRDAYLRSCHDGDAGRADSGGGVRESGRAADGARCDDVNARSTFGLLLGRASFVSFVSWLRRVCCLRRWDPSLGWRWAMSCCALDIVMSDAPMWLSATPDRRVLLFVSGLTLMTTIFFGLAPALQMTRRRQRRTAARQVLVAVQIAASCVLLIVAGLLVTSGAACADGRSGIRV